MFSLPARADLWLRCFVIFSETRERCSLGRSRVAVYSLIMGGHMWMSVPLKLQCVKVGLVIDFWSSKPSYTIKICTADLGLGLQAAAVHWHAQQGEEE